MASMVIRPRVVDFLDVVSGGQRTELRMEEITLSAGDPYAGRTIGETHIRSETGAYVLTIHSADGSLNSNPDPASLMQEGDRLVVLGSDEQLLMLANRACADAGVCYAPIHRRPA
jgi:K+/H+ antiporter YhaU regulatory subunit KhtT